MPPRTLTGFVALWVTAAVTTAGAPQHPHPTPAAAYIQALHVADSFLAAWVKRDVEVGLTLMSSAFLTDTPGNRAGSTVELREYMCGLSNPHHEAFEISKGRQVETDRFAFPVRLFELYLGEPAGSAYSDTLEVVREEAGWRVDRLPRNSHPD